MEPAMPLHKHARILGATAALALLTSAASPAQASISTNALEADSLQDSFTFGVIGDVPYGSAQVDRFPEMVSELNRQDELSFITHVGDIKAGSAQCTDEYFAAIKGQF